MSAEWVEFKVAPSNREERLCRMRLDTDRFSERLIREGVTGAGYEPDTTRLILRALQPGDSFIDVGAHAGYFSLIAAVAVGDEGFVASVEANPDNASRLEENARENGFANVALHRAAAGEAAGMATFFVNSDNDGGHALWDVGRHPWNQQSRIDAEKITVEVKTLDAIAGDRTPRVIKIDTEGAEYHVLKGAPELLARHPEFIICEANRFGLKQMGSSEAELRELMAGHGYECFYINDRAPWFVLLEPGKFVQADGIFNLLFSTKQAITEQLG